MPVIKGNTALVFFCSSMLHTILNSAQFRIILQNVPFDKQENCIGPFPGRPGTVTVFGFLDVGFGNISFDNT